MLIFGATLAGGAVLHGIHATPPTCPRGFICVWGTGPEPFSRYPAYPRQGWGDPIALAVCFLGFAGAAATLLTSRRRAAAVLVLGGTFAAATILYFQNQLVSKDCPHLLGVCSGPLQAKWFGGLVHFDDPAEVFPFHLAALTVGVLGAAGAALILLTARGPLANAALMIGASLLGAATLQVVGYPSGYSTCNFFTGPFGHAGRPYCVVVEGRRWVNPATLALVVLGVGGAGITARRQRS